jgi:hypothetical protein
LHYRLTIKGRRLRQPFNFGSCSSLSSGAEVHTTGFRKAPSGDGVLFFWEQYTQLFDVANVLKDFFSQSTINPICFRAILLFKSVLTASIAYRIGFQCVF